MKKKIVSRFVEYFRSEMCFNVTFGEAVIKCCANGSTIVGSQIWSRRSSRICENAEKTLSSEVVVSSGVDTGEHTFVLLPVAMFLIIMGAWIAIVYYNMRRR